MSFMEKFMGEGVAQSMGSSMRAAELGALASCVLAMQFPIGNTETPLDRDARVQVAQQLQRYLVTRVAATLEVQR